MEKEAKRRSGTGTAMRVLVNQKTEERKKEKNVMEKKKRLQGTRAAIRVWVREKTEERNGKEKRRRRGKRTAVECQLGRKLKNVRKK